MLGRTERLSFLGLRSWGKPFLFLAMALLLAGCNQKSKSAEELRGEIQDLKKEVKSMQEKLDKLQAGQQSMLALLQKPIQPPPAAEVVAAAASAGADGQPVAGEQGPLPGGPGHGEGQCRDR